jgi:tetratricopeptide (TPR) repeat protein
MLEHQFFHNPAFKDYIRLLFKLHVAIAEGWDETDEGEALRERMDREGNSLGSDEIASLNGISADFYSLTDPLPAVVAPLTADVWADLQPLFQPRKSKELHEVLDLLRKHAGFIPPASLAYLRGKIWMEAGEYQIAAAFLKRASELEPDNANYRYLALHAIWIADPLSATQESQAILSNPERHSPRMVLKAFDILLQHIRAQAGDQVYEVLKNYVSIVQNSIFRYESSGEVDPDLLGRAFNYIEYCNDHFTQTAITPVVHPGRN